MFNASTGYVVTCGICKLHQLGAFSTAGAKVEKSGEDEALDSID